MMCIYKITDLTNSKIYIGQTINFKRRIKDYKHKSLDLTKPNRRYRIMEVIHEKGFENFRFEIIEQITDRNLLNDREIYWIEALQSRDPDIGYNSKTGGSGGKMISESIQKMSNSSKKFKHSEKEKQRRKKAIYVYYIDIDEIEYFDSAKSFAYLLGIDRSMISHAVLKGSNFRGSYIFFADLKLREDVYTEIKNRKMHGGYNSRKSLELYHNAYEYVNSRLNAIIEESVETN